MVADRPLYEQVTADSFLEYAFLRWVLAPAVQSGLFAHIVPQREISVNERAYRVDYALEGAHYRIAVELDGFAYHGNRAAFTYDRLRQNDLHAAAWTVLRFSYDAVRQDTARCVAQLQAMLRLDPLLAQYCVVHPVIQQPDMPTDPLAGLGPAPHRKLTQPASFFEVARAYLRTVPLRSCQLEAFAALSNYYRSGGKNAACIMSVGAGKTLLGVVACLAFTRQRALIVTPGSVIRGTFDKAFDTQRPDNALYGLPGGPILPGCRPPKILTLDRDGGPISQVTRDDLLTADIIITNFHSLGRSEDPSSLLSKLGADDVDLIVVDEAHIAAAESYQRTFHHFHAARTLLMSACFQRLDGRPIDADVVYRYRLVDSIVDGHAKSPRVHRFAPQAEVTNYEMVWPDGSQEEIVGRDALLAIINDERKLARITAKSEVSIRKIMVTVKDVLRAQSRVLHPIKPRVLFSALGERHAEQIARIAEEYGIPCSYLHHSMSDARIKTTRERFEHESGDLQGIVQLKMLGQGYDFPPISVVVPMRPYGSFGEFYQFVGRGIRVLLHPALANRVLPSDQFLDIVYHAELGLDDHIDTLYHENEMDLHTGNMPDSARVGMLVDALSDMQDGGIDRGPEAFVLFEQGTVEQRIVHDEDRIEQRRIEREREAFAQRYAQYAQSTRNPVPFEQYVQVTRMTSE
jgi:superfamily II DNA or RNA helicase/very-short-patch-repair endonuclease